MAIACSILNQFWAGDVSGESNWLLVFLCMDEKHSALPYVAIALWLTCAIADGKERSLYICKAETYYQ